MFKPLIISPAKVIDYIYSKVFVNAILQAFCKLLLRFIIYIILVIKYKFNYKAQAGWYIAEQVKHYAITK